MKNRLLTPSDTSIVTNDKIDLRALCKVLWCGKRLIFVVTGLVTLIAVVIALALPNIYRSEVLLVAAESQGSVGSLAAQYGGLASIAGISLPGDGGGADKKTLALKVIKTRVFINYFVNKHDLSVPIMAAKKWDKHTGDLVIDNSIYDIEKKLWVRDVTLPQLPKPSDLEIYTEFIDYMSIGEDPKTGFVTVTVEHISPFLAQQWVEWLVEDLNEVISNDDVGRAERAIKYLNKQIATTALADSRAMFFQMIQEHMETAMLAKIEPEYALRTIDPAIVPEKQVKPMRALIVLIAIVLSGLLSMLYVVFLNESVQRDS